MSWLRARPRAALLAVLLAVVLEPRAAEAQLIEPGICPFSTPLADWREERFASEPWYEIKAFAVSGLHEALAAPPRRPACTKWHFTPSDDGQGLHARLAYRDSEGADGVVHGFAEYSTRERQPRFNLTFHGLADARSVDMKIVATDYDQFALLWGCSEPNLFERKVVSWVLSRQPYLSEGAQDALRSLFRRHDIRAEKYVITEHESCSDVRAFPDVSEDNDSVFANFRNADAPEVQRDRSSARSADVSWSYLGAAPGASSGTSSMPWWVDDLTQGPQGVFLAVLLAVAAMTALAAFYALLQRSRANAKHVPVLPVRRQDVVVATLGSQVDYSRFGGLGLGQGQLQTRKHAEKLASKHGATRLS